VADPDFAQRFGYRPKPIALDADDIPKSLKNGLWNTIDLSFFETIARGSSGFGVPFDSKFRGICEKLWHQFFQLRLDEIPDNPYHARDEIRNYYDQFEFVDLYRFLEFLTRLESPRFQKGGAVFGRSCNSIFQRELAAFRFADRTLVKVIGKEEIAEISGAITSSSTSVGTHIRRASELLTQQGPDYRNSIKESISAVESAVQFVTGKKTVGIARPLKAIADEFEFHPALRDGFEKLYAFTSDAEGIRHALLDEKGLSQEDARYMLVSCSAFANYLVALRAKA